VRFCSPPTTLLACTGQGSSCARPSQTMPSSCLAPPRSSRPYRGLRAALGGWRPSGSGSPIGGRVDSRLGPLQRRIIELLAGMGWTLTGDGALVGYHLGHRDTRDLDLFWHGLDELGYLPREVERRLLAAGLHVDSIQAAPAFRRLRVTDGHEVVPVGLVADPVPPSRPPVEAAPGVMVDPPDEILANKLNALLSRWAVRDLVDVRALLQAGLDLDVARKLPPARMVVSPPRCWPGYCRLRRPSTLTLSCWPSATT
jgi:hypothetical protein